MTLQITVPSSVLEGLSKNMAFRRKNDVLKNSGFSLSPLPHVIGKNVFLLETERKLWKKTHTFVTTLCLDIDQIEDNR